MIERLVRREVEELPEYVPGRSKEEVARRYGLDCEDVVKMASNENPFGPSPRAVNAVREWAEEVSTYPDSGADILRRELAKHLRLAPDKIIVGNGSDEIIELALKAFLNPGEEVLIPFPTFSMYESFTRLYSGRVVRHPLSEEFDYDIDGMLARIGPRTKIVFLCSPNNPTGSVVTRKGLTRILGEDVLVLLDEAYAEFAEESMLPLVNEHENLLVLRTFSKAYGLAGLRVGYGVGDARVINYLFRVKPPFNVNIIAQHAAVEALGDTEHLEQTVARTIAGRKYLTRELSSLPGVRVYPSQGNFLLIELPGEVSARELVGEMMREGVIVRSCEGFGMVDRYIRVSVGREEENLRFVEIFREKLPHEK
jgi:histidinol-phosphate aminotransferase